MKSHSFQQFALFKAPALSHGGALREGKRKIARPLDPRRPLHLVLKSSQARGSRSFLQAKYVRRIPNLIEKTAKRFSIKVLRFVNVGNHLHLLIQFQDRGQVQNFIRLLSGQIALWVSGAKKGQKKGKFWDQLCFTRIINWGKDFALMTRYFIKNELQSLGQKTHLAQVLVRQGVIYLKE